MTPLKPVARNGASLGVTADRQNITATAGELIMQWRRRSSGDGVTRGKLFCHQWQYLK